MNALRYLLLGAVLLAAGTSTSHASQEKVKLEIFYETLNEVAAKFFLQQFRLVSETLSDTIDLRLFPYGRSVFSHSKYVCPYGEQQCVANKLHACFISGEMTQPKSSTGLLDSPVNQTAVSRFANCFFKNRFSDVDILVLGRRCQSSARIEADWAELHSCVVEPDNTLTDQLKAISEKVATDLKEDGLVVRIRGTANPGAKTNLLGAICSALETSAPAICANSATPLSKVKIGVYFEALDLVAYNYIVSQLSNWYHVLEDMTEIDIVPYGYSQLLGDAYPCPSQDTCILNKFIALIVDDYLTTPKNGDTISGAARVINFLSCLAQSTRASVFSLVEECVREKLRHPGEYTDYLRAIKSNDAKVREVIKSNRLKTEAIADTGSLSPVPTITVNSVVNDNAFYDLIGETCAQYVGPITAAICTKVQVTVLYEPLNRKSRTLFLEQLQPIFGSLYNVIDLKVLPVGRAILAPGQEGFVCRAGASAAQCKAMMLQLCAIDYFNEGNSYPDPIRPEVFDFIACTFKNKLLLNVTDVSEYCSEEIEDDAWYAIDGCLTDGSGNGIFSEYIQQVQRLGFDIADAPIPQVIINDTVNVTDFTQIKSTICGFLDEYHTPDYCLEERPAKVEISVFYDSMSLLSETFLTRQYFPYYNDLETMANIKLYPAGNVEESTGNSGECASMERNSACMANKLQALIIDRYTLHDDDGDDDDYDDDDDDDDDDDGEEIDGKFRTIMFLGCVFELPASRDNIYLAYEFCTNVFLLDDWYDILLTAQTKASNAVYKQVLDLTEKFKKANGLTEYLPVPWVTLDNQRHSMRAADELLKTVCSQYTGSKPLACTPVQVEVYYTSVHALSRRFFLHQLIPVYRNLRELIDIKLIPYGVVDGNSNLDDECAQNKVACDGNILQACAIERIFRDENQDTAIQWDGTNQTISFVNCMFKNVRGNRDIWPIAKGCAVVHFIQANEVLQCAHGKEGKALLEANRQRTASQFETVEHTPWIVVNGLHSALAESDLKRAVCNAMLVDLPDYCHQQDYIPNGLYPPFRDLDEILEGHIQRTRCHTFSGKEKPHDCYQTYDSDPKPDPKPVVEIHYSPSDARSVHFFSSSLLHHVPEIAQVSLIPFGRSTWTDTIQSCVGDVDCLQHREHACLIDLYLEEHPMETLSAISCTFGELINHPHVLKECVNQNFQDILPYAYRPIAECFSSGGADDLMSQNGLLVSRLAPKMSHLPWVTVNGGQNIEAEVSLFNELCASYYPDDGKPSLCQSALLPVNLHHETKNQDVSGLMLSQLSLYREDLDELGSFEFIPYGRTSVSKDVFTCSVDEDQWRHANKVHACVINGYHNQSALNLDYEKNRMYFAAYLVCSFFREMSHSDAVANAEACLSLNFEGHLWRDIHLCARGLEGDHLMKEMGPQTDARTHLMEALCNSYVMVRPALCATLPTHAVPIKIYFSANAQGQKYFREQLRPFYEEFTKGNLLAGVCYQYTGAKPTAICAEQVTLPTGSGTTPVMSLFVFISFLLSFLLSSFLY